MAKYLIHACNDRLWYVKEYLIPSMVEQGIRDSDIAIYLDEDNDGCLEACMKAFLLAPINDGSIWHMQDDVIICHDFKERSEKLADESGVVCGYCYGQDGRKDYTGKVRTDQIWYSFPCIKIPNLIARGCADWYFRYAKYHNEYHVYVNAKKYDDVLFDIYLRDYHGDTQVLNLVPSLVDHVDYLIGGSIVNQIRVEKETHSVYFEDHYLIDELTEKLKER